MEHEEMKLVLIWKLYYYEYVFTVLENALHSTREE